MSSAGGQGRRPNYRMRDGGSWRQHPSCRCCTSRTTSAALCARRWPRRESAEPMRPAGRSSTPLHLSSCRSDSERRNRPAPASRPRWRGSTESRRAASSVLSARRICRSASRPWPPLPRSHPARCPRCCRLSPARILDLAKRGTVTAVRRRALVRRWVQDYSFSRTNRSFRHYLAPCGLGRALDQLTDHPFPVPVTGPVAARQ